MAVSCDRAPAGPSSGGGTSMAITAVTPETPLQSPAPQTLLVQGRNFLSEPVLFITDPNGGERVVAGPDINDRQISSFRATVLFTLPGRHELRVGPSAGAQSPPFAVIVRSTETAPIIFAISPPTVVRGPTTWVVTIDGLNFDPGAMVTITDPEGVVTLLSAGQMLSATASALQFTRVFSRAGFYTFVVTNPTGEMSNTVTVSAT